MADITVCKGGSCPLRLNCYRYTCPKEDLGQSYFIEPPYKMNMMLDENFRNFGIVTTACTHFWNNAKYKDDEPKELAN